MPFVKGFLRICALFLVVGGIQAQPLTINITGPTNNSTLPPGDITVEASVFVPPGSMVFLVEFFANGLYIGEAGSEPFSTLWMGVTEGDYVLIARAWDEFGDNTDSEPVVVHVRGSGSILRRGPYLQMGTPTSVIIRWRSSVSTDSVVHYGLSEGNLNQVAQINTLSTDHEVPLSGLLPNTRYFYSVGSSASPHSAGPDHFFITSPAGPKPTRIWVTGDSGTAARQGEIGAFLVRDAYYDFAGDRYTDVWLMLGDNAYDRGTDAEYQRGMFDVYPQILRQTVVWSCIGNHDAPPIDDPDAPPPYLDFFSFPANGEAGGVPSGVENYYSFDYGDIHFISLAGYYSGSRLSNGVMCTWLKADLEANTNKWLIAFWHQPPYTKGSHNSDGEIDLIEMRENSVPILESYGVDLVLCGHSHNYERSYLLHGHYGFSWELDPAMRLDPGSGQIGDTGPYIKQATGDNANRGAVYVVAGSSGWTSFCCTGLDHPAMYSSLGVMGSLVLDIDGDTLHGKFLRENGNIDDHFTIVKQFPIQIVAVGREGNATTLSWSSRAGRRYQLEHTVNLGGSWGPVGQVIQAAGAVTKTTHATGTATQGFYRVLQVD